MKKILLFLMLTCVTTFLTAQGAGIRYVNGVPTAATYTPKIPKGESVRCFSLTNGKYYYWDITVFPPLWREEILNSVPATPVTFEDGGGVKHYVNGGTNANYFALGDDYPGMPLVRTEQNVPDRKRRWINSSNERYTQYNGLGFMQSGGVDDGFIFGAPYGDETSGTVQYNNYADYTIETPKRYGFHYFDLYSDSYSTNRPGLGFYNDSLRCGLYMGQDAKDTVTSLYLQDNRINLTGSNKINFSKYTASRNDGQPKCIAWFDDDGFLNRSPVSSVIPTTSNTLTNDYANQMKSNVNGIISIAPIVTSVQTSIVGNQLFTRVNGQTSQITLPGVVTTNTLANNSYNELTSTVNNISSATPIISSLSHSISGNTLTTTVNNVQAAVVLPSSGGANYTAGTGISIANNVITNTAPNQNQTLSLAGQTLSLTNGGSVTLPNGGNNIYNSNGSIPNGVTRTVSIPDQNVVAANTKLVFDASSTAGSFYKPVIKLDVNPYKDIAFPNNLGASNLEIDFGGYAVNTSNKLKVLCEPNQNSVSSTVHLREVTLGIPDLPQASGAVTLRTNLHTNGKPEKVAWVTLVLTNIQTPNTLCSQFSTAVNNLPFETHKVTIFDPTTKKYLEAFYVENVGINGGFRTNCYVFNPGGMYNPNQTGASVQALIYYTE